MPPLFKNWQEIIPRINSEHRRNVRKYREFQKVDEKFHVLHVLSVRLTFMKYNHLENTVNESEAI